MAISLVNGGAIARNAGNGGDVTITLPTLQQGDVVYLFGGSTANSGYTPGDSLGAYTTVVSPFTSGGTGTANGIFGVWRKVMGATPDTQVIGLGTGNLADVVVYGVYCLRGVDTTVFEDATPTTTTGTGTTPNCPSITFSTPQAWMLAVALNRVNDASITAPTGWLNLIQGTGNDTQDSSLAGVTLVGNPTLVDPPAYGTWSVSNWCAATLAIRPADVNPGSGGEALGGTANVTFTPLIVSFPYTASGGLSLGNSATAKSKFIAKASGGLSLGGTAPVTFTSSIPTFTYTASGGLSLGNSSPASLVLAPFTYTASGGLAVGGSSPLGSNAVIIGSVIAGTVISPTGTGTQSHLIWAVNDAAWWLFYISSTSNTTVLTYRSPDGVNWTAKTASGAFANADVSLNAGESLGVIYKNISSNDVVHCSMLCRGTVDENQHARATISGGSITWGSWAVVGTSPSRSISSFPGGCNSVIDSNNTIVDLGNMQGATVGKGYASRSTNTDSGTSWTAGFNAATQIFSVTNFINAFAAFDTGGGNVLALGENASTTEANSMTNVLWSQWTGASWSASANVFTSNLSSGVDPNNFGAVARTTSDVHCVIFDGTSTFTHRRFNGTSWSAGDSIQSESAKPAAGLFMATDGSNVWLFVIDNASGNVVRYNKWTSGSGWSGWQGLELSSATRNNIDGYNQVVNNQIGIVWTQTNGSDFDVAFETLSIGQQQSSFTYTASGNLSLGNSASVTFTPNGTTFTYAASGGLSLGNSSPASQSPFAYTASGSLSLGNSSTVVPKYIYNASGSLTLSGNASVIAPSAFLYTASGGLALGNTSPVVPKYVYNASGGLSLSNSSSASLTVTYNASGTLSLGNSSPVTPRYLYNASGGLSLGSSASVQGPSSFTYNATGGLSLGNSASVTQSSFTYSASGALSLGSSSPNVLAPFVYNSSGGVSLGNSSSAVPHYLYVASGGLSLTGVAGVSTTIPIHVVASGGLSLGNTSPVIAKYLYAASGGLSLSNSSPNSITAFTYNASGGLTLSGSANVTPRYLYNASGGLSLSNSSIVKDRFTYTASGGLSLNNSAPVQAFYTYTASGGLFIKNAALKQITFSYNSAGGLSLGNSVNFSTNYNYTSFGGLGLSGTVNLSTNYSVVASGGLSLGGIVTATLSQVHPTGVTVIIVPSRIRDIVVVPRRREFVVPARQTHFVVPIRKKYINVPSRIRNITVVPRK